MKIQIELIDNLEEDEIVIRCRHLSEEIRHIEEAVKKINNPLKCKLEEMRIRR